MSATNMETETEAANTCLKRGRTTSDATNPTSTDTSMKLEDIPRKAEPTETGTTLTPAYATSNDFLVALVKTSANQLPIADGKIYVAHRNDKVVDVLKGLINHNFLSCPVVVQKGNSTKYYGFIDLADIVRFVVSQFGETTLKDFGENFWKLVEKEELFQTRTVGDLMVYPLSSRNPFHEVRRGYSLFHVFEILARERGVHRVPIIDEGRRIVHLATQSQILDFLSKNLANLGTICNKPLSQLQHITTDVLCVKHNEIAMEAFSKMIKQTVTGVGVIDTNGKLIGNLSLRDLKCISSDGSMFWRLYQTVEVFITKLNKEFNRSVMPITLRIEDTVELAIRTLSENKVHRIYLVDHSKKPISVITIKDILFEILTH
jgi:5'-AMP-activated protein kinase regulatory gamma subunit